MELEQLLSEMPRFDQHGIGRPALNFSGLASFADRLYTVRPEKVQAVIAIPPTPVRSRRRWLNLVTVAGGYRTDFALIHHLAVELAPEEFADSK